MKTDLTFLSGHARMVKTFSMEGSQTYPLVKKFTSHKATVSIDETGLAEFEQQLRFHAAQGNCFYKGNLTTELKNESRAGKTNTLGRTQVLVIDIDGYHMPGTMPEMPWGKEDVKHIADTIIGRLPAEFNGVSYIAQASASMGMKGHNIVSMHLFFFLDEPVNPSQLKNWLTQLNLQNPAFADQLRLTASGLQLSYIIDRCMAENSRIIYIAPPVIRGLKDPFDGDNEARIVRHQGRSPVVTASKLISGLNPQKVTTDTDAVIADLRKRSNLAAKKPKTTMVKNNGRSFEMLQNPDRMTLELSYVKDPFVYLNVNGGDSNAYYFPLENPRWVHNFKGEPAFELYKADPAFFQWAIEEYREYFVKDASVKPMVFRDFATDAYYTIEFDTTNNVVKRFAMAAKQSLEDFMEERFEVMPDPIETWTVEFNPNAHGGIDSEQKYFNLFTPTPQMLNFDINEEYKGMEYGFAAPVLESICPSITKLIMHVLGNGQREFEHFINWLAEVFTAREKTSVAWMMQGIEGTGKGILFNRVITPLFSEQYATMKRMSDLEDNFDGWREQNLITAIDEFKLSDSKSMSKAYNQIKNLISEPTGTVRYMRTNPKQVKLYANYLFFTNNEDAMRLADKDRRFCVGIRQEYKLGSVCSVPELLNGIEEEIDTFAAFLNVFNVDSAQARTALENDAKSAMRVASSTWVDDLCHAMTAGNIDFFIENVLINTPDDIMKNITFNTNVAIICNWIHDAAMGVQTQLSISDARAIYNSLNGQEMSMPSFRKTMARHAVEFKMPASRGRAPQVLALPVDWKPSSYDLQRLLNQHLPPNDSRKKDIAPDD